MTISEKTKEFQRQVSSALTQLLELKLSDENETKELLEVLAISVSENGGDNGKRIFLNRTLECINEPETLYYENDSFVQNVNQIRGRRIYSPRIDL